MAVCFCSLCLRLPVGSQQAFTTGPEWSATMANPLVAMTVFELDILIHKVESLCFLFRLILHS